MSSHQPAFDDALYLLHYAEPNAVIDPRIYAVIDQKVETVGMGAKQQLRAPDQSLVGHWNLRWKMIPHDHYALPEKVLPGEPLTGEAGQRFVMNDLFRLDSGDGFYGFGCGQILGKPHTPTQPRIAAVGTMMRGQGRLRGKQGIYIVQGTMDLKQGFRGLVLLRVAARTRETSAGNPAFLREWTSHPAMNLELYCFQQEEERTALFLAHANTGSLEEAGERWRPGTQAGLASVDNQLPLGDLKHHPTWGEHLAPLPYLSQGVCHIGQADDSFSFHLVEGRAIRQTPGSSNLQVAGFGLIGQGRGRYQHKCGVIVISGRAAHQQMSGCMLVNITDMHMQHHYT